MVGLVVPDVLVGELVLLHNRGGLERVDGCLALSEDTESEEHDPRTGVEVAHGELGRCLGTSLSRR